MFPNCLFIDRNWDFKRSCLALPCLAERPNLSIGFPLAENAMIIRMVPGARLRLDHRKYKFISRDEPSALVTSPGAHPLRP
jgi:hypothetical protein